MKKVVARVRDTGVGMQVRWSGVKGRVWYMFQEILSFARAPAGNHLCKFRVYRRFSRPATLIHPMDPTQDAFDPAICRYRCNLPNLR